MRAPNGPKRWVSRAPSLAAKVRDACCLQTIESRTPHACVGEWNRAPRARREIDDLDIRCDLCAAKLKHGKWKEHLKQCKALLIMCDVPGCGELTLGQTFDAHEQQPHMGK